jgi:hypothetical protein
MERGQATGTVVDQKQQRPTPTAGNGGKMSTGIVRICALMFVYTLFALVIGAILAPLDLSVSTILVVSAATLLLTLRILARQVAHILPNWMILLSLFVWLLLGTGYTLWSGMMGGPVMTVVMLAGMVLLLVVAGLAWQEHSGGFLEAETLRQDAAVARASGDHEKAETLLRDSVARAESNRAARDGSLAACCWDLAALLKDQRRWSEAAEMLSKAASAAAGRSDENSRRILEAAPRTLCHCLESANQPARVEQLALEHLRMAQEAEALSFWTLALAGSLMDQGRAAEALPMLEGGLQSWQRQSLPAKDQEVRIQQKLVRASRLALKPSAAGKTLQAIQEILGSSVLSEQQQEEVALFVDDEWALLHMAARSDANAWRFLRSALQRAEKLEAHAPELRADRYLRAADLLGRLQMLEEARAFTSQILSLQQSLDQRVVESARQLAARLED